MTRPLNTLVAPAYLLVCLLAGGSNQGVWANLALQLIAIAILAAAVASPDPDPDPERRRALGALPLMALLFLALVMIELVPLAPRLWAGLPGRGSLADGLALLGGPLPWAAWSIDPSASIAALMPLLVPLAMLAALVRGGAARPHMLVGALFAGTVMSILLGLLQMRSGGEHWYLYRFSSFGQPSGFFANSNHMGTLLLVNIPFVAAFASDQLRGRADLSQRGLVLAGAVGLAVVLLIAVVLNRSTALLLLGGPVLLLSVAIPQWWRPGTRKWLAGAAALGLAAAIALAAGQGRMGMTGEDSSVQTRVEIWSTAARAADDFKLTGSGLGTFQRAYRHYEDPNRVDLTYVNHAHNDYLELVLELGLPGLLLILLFLGWWARRAISAWRSAQPYARAATIGSATILLHSLVDFPLRTSAIAALFAACVGVMISRRAPAAVANPDDLWPSRHLVAN